MKRKFVFSILGGLCLGLGIYSTFIEPKRLTTTHLEIITEKNGSFVRIVHLSDLHIGKFYGQRCVEKLVDKVNAVNPDIVVFTGDLFDRFDCYLREETAMPLKKIRAPLGKYAVWGNHDRTHMRWRFSQFLEKIDFTLLVNTGATICLQNQKRLAIAGTDDWLYGNPDKQAVITAMAGKDYRILLMHEPDAADLMDAHSVDLILSGHTHGGQVKLPCCPTVTTPMGKKYARGLFKVGESAFLYVNRGIGTTHLPLRAGAIPEITVIDIKI